MNIHVMNRRDILRATAAGAALGALPYVHAATAQWESRPCTGSGSTRFCWSRTAEPRPPLVPTIQATGCSTARCSSTRPPA